jgi:hypothetical protein
MHVAVEVPVALITIVIPILPGKTPAWRTFIEELNGSRHQEFADSRRAAGVHERTFLQQSPMGDFVIVTLEGDDPGRSFGQLMGGTDDFSKWFTQNAMAAHGDLAQANLAPAELVADSD